MGQVTSGYMKRARKREPGYPTGVAAPLYLDCGCGEKVPLPVIAGLPMTYICGRCGTEYDAEGWIIKEPNRFRMHYECPNDGTTWSMEWSCACNDRCPKCDAEIQASRVEDI